MQKQAIIPSKGQITVPRVGPDHGPKTRSIARGGYDCCHGTRHQLVVATRNEGDFRQLDLRILNPFKTS
jgi:hypothetical protein